MSLQALPAQAKHLFHYLFEQASLGIAVEDIEGKLLLVNPALCAMLGYGENELCGMNCSQFADSEDSQDDWALFQQLRAGVVDQYSLEKRYRRKDGAQIWGRLNVSLLKNRDGDSPLVFAFVEDVTERRRTEEALRESEQRLRLALQAGSMYAFDWDVETDAIVRSGKGTDIFNWTEDPMRDTGREFYARVHPDDREVYTAAGTGLTPENPGYQISFRVLRPNGSEIWLEDTGRALFDASGRMLRVTGMVADITERKRAEEVLRQKEAELSEAQRLAGVGSWQWNAQTDKVIWSKELCRLVGHDPSLPPPPFKEHPGLLAVERWDRLQHAVEEALDAGKAYELDIQIVRPESACKWVIARGEPLRAANGQIIGLRGTVQDITQRKEAEAALASVNRRLIEAQEQERTRIGRELHDDIGQRLALAAIELQHLQQDPRVLPEVRERVAALHKQTTEIAADIQSLSHELHSSKLQYLGISAAMRGFCQEFGQQQKLKIDFRADDLPSSLPPDISLCFFRVLQEALHNSAKHSGARHFEVRLWGTSGEIHLTVTDSGVGFDSDAAKTSRGLGLVSIEERLRILNGTFSIESQPQRGTRIHARIPFSPGSDFMRAAG
ncbi:MAG: PAS domain S-box protein [Terriglobales bacterium]